MNRHIEAQWQQFRKEAMAPGFPEELIELMRCAFFRGAIGFLWAASNGETDEVVADIKGELMEEIMLITAGSMDGKVAQC